MFDLIKQTVANKQIFEGNQYHVHQINEDLIFTNGTDNYLTTYGNEGYVARLTL